MTPFPVLRHFSAAPKQLCLGTADFADGNPSLLRSPQINSKSSTKGVQHCKSCFTINALLCSVLKFLMVLFSACSTPPKKRESQMSVVPLLHALHSNTRHLKCTRKQYPGRQCRVQASLPPLSLQVSILAEDIPNNRRLWCTTRLVSR